MESLGVDGQIILKWILQKTGREGMGWIYMNQDGGQVFGCCEYGDKPDGSIRCW